MSREYVLRHGYYDIIEAHCAIRLEDGLDTPKSVNGWIRLRCTRRTIAGRKAMATTDVDIIFESERALAGQGSVRGPLPNAERNNGREMANGDLSKA